MTMEHSRRLLCFDAVLKEDSGSFEGVPRVPVQEQSLLAVAEAENGSHFRSYNLGSFTLVRFFGIDFLSR